MNKISLKKGLEGALIFGISLASFDCDMCQNKGFDKSLKGRVISTSFIDNNTLFSNSTYTLSVKTNKGNKKFVIYGEDAIEVSQKISEGDSVEIDLTQGEERPNGYLIGPHFIKKVN